MRECIVVAMGIGSPDDTILREIEEKIPNIQIKDVLVASSPFDEEKLSAYRHGILVLHRDNEHGLESARIAIAMTRHVEVVAIATVTGGWNREYRKFVYTLAVVEAQ